MKSMQELICDGRDALCTVLPSPDSSGQPLATATPGGELRLLALINPLLRRIVEDAAASVGSSAVKATAFAQLAEELHYLAGYGQILAAGKIEDTEAHTLTAEPLVELREILADPASFLAGTAELPDGRRSRPGTKHLCKDAAQFLKNHLRLSFPQAKLRLAAAGRLVPRTGFNNKSVEPGYPELAKLLKDGHTDPQLLASTAGQLEKMRPGLERLHGTAGVAEAESKLADALHTRDAAGINWLLKVMSIALDHTVIDDEEAVHQANFGMRYRGKRAQGYFWEITTGVEGHEMLSTLADQLNNPRKPGNANRKDRAPKPPAGSPPREGNESATPELPGLEPFGSMESPAGRRQNPESAESEPEAPRIPDWAIDPATPQELRPVAGFTDPGTPVPPEPPPEMLPGETPEQAKTRIRDRRLLQSVFDAIRYTAFAEPGATAPDPGLPMKPNLDIIVTLSWDSLVGKLNDPGLSSHGHLISAATVRALAAKANLIPAVMGTQGQPLDLGRTQRFFTRAQRRALTIRDRGCINPGCSMPAHRCEANHIKPWFIGGKTNLGNACLLCTGCHAAFHAGHFAITVSDGIPYVIASKAHDPEQTPRRNWIWHPEAEAA